MSTLSNILVKPQPIIFGHQEFILDGEGALFWTAKNMVIFSDLHLEKGSYLSAQGYPLPLYDSRETLLQMKKVMDYFQPKAVMCLGDSFHDYRAIHRMQLADREFLINLIRHTHTWHWILGNHDKNIKFFECPEERIEKNKIMEMINFTHDYDVNSPLQIIGHYHPKVSVVIKNHRIRGKCFAVSDRVLVMPAFGSYTGGLDVLSDVFREIISPSKAIYYLIKKGRVWPLLGDGVVGG